jgi:ABC-type amino acid transport substrate-binding protein
VALLALSVGMLMSGGVALGQSPQPSAAPPDGMLARVLEAGKIIMSTDPQYPPQSELVSDGSFQGFDIDVGKEIASRLGVAIEFVTPSFDVVSSS